MSHLKREGVAAGTEVGEGDHRHPGLPAQIFYLLGGEQRDLRKGLGVGFDVDGGVGEEDGAVALQDHVHARRHLGVGLQADDAQGRADGVLIVHGHAGHETVGVPLLKHQHTKEDGVEQGLGGRAAGDAPTLPQGKILLAVGLVTWALGGADDLDSLEAHAGLPGHAVDRGDVPQHNGGADSGVRQLVTGPQDAGLVALGEDDAFGGVFGHGADVGHNLAAFA